MKFLKKIRDWLLNITSLHIGKLKFVAAIIPGLGAVVLAFYKDAIVGSTNNFLKYIIGEIPENTSQTYVIDFKVIIYYMVIFLWIVSYYFFILNESITSKKTVQENKAHLDIIKNELNSAIHKAPNPKIFSGHKFLFDGIFNILLTLESEIKDSLTNNELIRLYNKNFKSILERICIFTKEYSQKNTIYGANIMRYIRVEPNKSYVQKLRHDKDCWVYYKMLDIDYIPAVLHVISDLTYTGSDTRLIPTITLPIFRKEDKNVIPGACKAFWLGDSVFNDVTNLEEYNDFQKKDSQEYFDSSGKNIKSIISISIPGKGFQSNEGLPLHGEEQPIVAVLNIDCESTFPLGQDEDYYGTYFALLRPIAYLFSRHLENYFKLLPQ